jgi:hypothetical protein
LGCIPPDRMLIGMGSARSDANWDAFRGEKM